MHYKYPIVWICQVALPIPHHQDVLLHSVRDMGILAKTQPTGQYHKPLHLLYLPSNITL
jgi:hypothetical protein